MDSTWALVLISGGQFVLTVLVIVWRMSALVKSESIKYESILRKHEIDDQKAFAEIGSVIAKGDDEIRKELTAVSSGLSAAIMAAQSSLTDRLNKVELRTEREFIHKDSFYAALADLKNQNKDDFTEIKAAIKELQSKIDGR